MSSPGQRIRERRIALRIKQYELARLAGMAQSSLSELERGDTYMPSAEALLRLSKVLGVTQAWIVTGREGELETLDKEEEKLFGDLRKLTAEQKAAVYSLVRTMVSKKPE